MNMIEAMGCLECGKGNEDYFDWRILWRLFGVELVQFCFFWLFLASIQCIEMDL